MFLQRCLVQISLLVAASAWPEILHAPEKDIVVSKNANVSEERALFSEHNGSSFNTTSRPVFNWTGNTFVLNLFPSNERKSERELERGKGIEWRDISTSRYDLTGWLPWCKSREKHDNFHAEVYNLLNTPRIMEGNIQHVYWICYQCDTRVGGCFLNQHNQSLALAHRFAWLCFRAKVDV